MKLMPIALAFASASQAVHSATSPSAMRSALDRCGQPAGPARKAQMPPSTHSKVATHHAAGGAPSAQRAHFAGPQAAASSTPSAIAVFADTPFKRPHSQPPAPIITSVSTANGQAIGGADARDD